jgi:SAM-dependent methyltransferase
MGITYQEARQLLQARQLGASFDALGTLGRQSLYIRADEAASLCREFDLQTDAPWLRQRMGDVADSFFVDALGATSLVAIDASAYEGADFILDMNKPVPAGKYQSFDAVLDGGSLEHIFDVPMALANLMRLARVGGRVFIATPSNNLCGHGFYQFSPELMFRVFTEDRGFRLHDVGIFEYDLPDVTQRPSVAAWRVADPAAVGQRVGLMTRHAAIMWVHSEKTRHLDDPFAEAPQQSDYVDLWADDSQGGVPGGGTSPAKARLRHAIPPAALRKWREHELRRRFSTRNRRFYTRLP